MAGAIVVGMTLGSSGGWVYAYEVFEIHCKDQMILLMSPCANMLIVQEVAVLPIECGWCC